MIGIAHLRMITEQPTNFPRCVALKTITRRGAGVPVAHQHRRAPQADVRMLSRRAILAFDALHRTATRVMPAIASTSSSSHFPPIPASL